MNSNTHALVRSVLFTPTDDGWGVPALFWGSPGVGKTKILSSVASEYGMVLQVLSPGLMGEGAFGAIPVPVGAGASARITYPAPRWLEKFEDEDGLLTKAGIVFVDELTTAPPGMQAPLLGLVQERRIGFDYMGPRVRVLAAANPPSIAANGHDLSAPVANRMAHFDWHDPASTDWSEYMAMRAPPQPGSSMRRAPTTEQEQQCLDTEAKVLAGWGQAFAATLGPVSSFLRRSAKSLNAMPAADDPNASRAWPSPRSWDLAVSVMTTAKILGETQEVVDSLLSSLVGRELAVEFAVFRRDMDLPDPADVLDGKVTWVPDPARVDRSFATLDSMVALVSPKSAHDRTTRACALWDILGRVAKTSPDIVAPMLKPLTAAGLGASSPEPLIVARSLPVLGSMTALMTMVQTGRRGAA